MSNCSSIFVKGISVPASVPAHKRTRGGVYLDTDTDFQFRLSRVLEELSDLSKIKVDGALGFSLPSTPLNDLILRPFILPSVADSYSRALNVFVFVGSRTLQMEQMFVLGYKGGQYECEIRMGEEHWIVGAKDLKLKDIDLGDEFVYDYQNMIPYNNLGGYTDGTQGVRFPAAFYGKWASNQDRFTIDTLSFRPFYSLLWMLQKGFCNLGWSFRSPVFESDWGRRLICYLMDKDYTSKAVNLDEKLFSAVSPTQSITIQSGTIINWVFQNEILDNGGHYNNATGKYYGAGVHDITIAFSDLPSFTILTAEIITYTIFLYMRSTALAEDILIDSKDFGGDNEAIINGEAVFVVKDVQIDAGDYVYAAFRINVLGSIALVENISIGGRISNSVTEVALQVGDVFKFNDILGDDKFLDLLKGATHLVAGKLHTDYATKTIWLYPTYNKKIYGNEVVEGYFLESASVEIKDKVVCDSEEVDTPSLRENRYKTFKFKGDGDYQVDQLNLKEHEYYLGYEIDYGEQYNEEYDLSENPFFHVTVNKMTQNVSGVTWGLVDIPHIYNNYDEENPKADYKIDPRILYWYGQAEQEYNGEVMYIGGFDDVPPYAYQYPMAKRVGGLDFEGGVAYGELGVAMPSEYLLNNNLYKFFWQKWLNETDINFGIGLLLYLAPNEFFRYSFRDQYTFNFLGRTLFGRIKEIDDFSVCDDTPTPVKFLPNRQSLSACLEIPSSGGLNPCATNAPILNIVKSGNTYNFSLGGTNTSAVSSVTFQWKYVGTSLWVTATSVTAPSGSFEVRMIVVYADGCPQITRNRLVDACGNAPTFSFQYNYNNNCFTITTGGVVSSPITSVLIEFSEDSGANWLPYVPCQATVASEIQVMVTWTFADGCVPITITNTYAIPPTELNCAATNADALCDENTGLFTLNGNVHGDVALDIIEWREVGDTTWLIWDGVTPILDCPFEYRRVIFFCGDECPTYCGTVRTCSCTPCVATVAITVSAQNPDDSYDLTASLTNCTTPMYSWYINTGSGFVSLGLMTATINATISGTYKVVVMCSSGCEVEDEQILDVSCSAPAGSPNNIEICN